MYIHTLRRYNVVYYTYIYMYLHTLHVYPYTRNISYYTYMGIHMYNGKEAIKACT